MVGLEPEDLLRLAGRRVEGLGGAPRHDGVLGGVHEENGARREAADVVDGVQLGRSEAPSAEGERRRARPRIGSAEKGPQDGPHAESGIGHARRIERSLRGQRVEGPPQIGDRLRREAPVDRFFQLGINLSCAQLSSPTVVDRFLAGVDAVGLDARDLVVEVTETELVEDGSMAERSLLALAAAGTQIAVDDFGAGYSSFDYLTRMPVTFLKIDRRLTRALPTNARSRRVLRALVTMCLDMGVALIAEGIETETERAAYLDIGIETGQGFLFKPGISVDELVADLRTEVSARR